MKHLFLTALLALLCLPSFGYQGQTSQKPKRRIHVTQTTTAIKHERSLQPCANAFLCPEEGTIEVELIETGETSIYILDAHNMVVEQATADSDFNYTVTLDAPDTKGTYYIIIESPALYGEGTFNIN